MRFAFHASHFETRREKTIQNNRREKALANCSPGRGGGEKK